MFKYNNTLYSPSLIFDGFNYIATNTLNIPSVTSTINKTFFWILNLGSGQVNTTATNQTVNNLSVDNCTVNTLKILNFTLYDEATQVLIPNGVLGNGTIELNLNIYPLNQYQNNNFLVSTFSQNYNATNNALVCINSNALNSSYYMDVQVRYTALGYAGEFYNIQKYLLNNLTMNQNISLFDLLGVSSTAFQITYKDENLNPVPNALINIQRKYVGENVFKTVEIPMTDINGITIGHFDLSNVLYSITVTRFGETLATFTSITPVCTDPSVNQCQINLNAVTGSTGFFPYSVFSNINYNMSWDEFSRTITVQFNTIDGSITNMFLNATDLNQTTIYCSNSLLSSAGIFTCTIPQSVGNLSFLATLYSNNNFVSSSIFSISNAGSPIFGNDRMFYVFLLLLTLPFLFITSLYGFLIAIPIAFVLANLLGFYYVGAIFGIGSSIIWLCVVILIVIWRINRKSRGYAS